MRSKVSAPFLPPTPEPGLANLLRASEPALSQRILLVDENELIRRALRSCIEENTNWCICGEAENGKVAIEKVKVLGPDMVFLDVQMPVMNGFEAARQIRLVAPSTVIVMVTMHSCEEVLQDTEAGGIKHVISKSDWSPDQLISSLKKVCVRPPAP